MKAKWSVIPELNDIDRFVELSAAHGAAFEYNDFFMPYVYEDKEETDRRISLYNSLDRDRSRDTLHGVFYDTAVLSVDSVIRERSRELFRQSLDIARRLSCKGVVFHTGRLAGLDTFKYHRTWLAGMDDFLHELASAYKDTEIYIENTFEKDPKILAELMERSVDLKNVGICFDYAHAMLTNSDHYSWIEELAPYIKHIHINDHDMKADLHLAVGDGKIDYGLFAKVIKDYEIDVQILHEVNGYDNALRSLEYMENLQVENCSQ